MRRPIPEHVAIKDEVAQILLDIKVIGTEAVRRYAKQFDRVALEHFEIERGALAQLASQVGLPLQQAIRTASANISAFHEAQVRPATFIETLPGVLCSRKGIPIERVGIYIPGGTAPLFSTVLMLGIPAKIAGCKEIVLCTPPNDEGLIHPAIAFAAQLVGIERVFAIGGVQAIGAMAYGTHEIPRVNKIFGPGNQYVTAAKQLVSAEGIAIDLPAGPSELAVLADESCNPTFVAADLLSQAEHGVDSQVILLSDSERVIEEIEKALEYQLATLPRREIALQALSNSRAFLVSDLDQGMSLLNAYAPEHLIIACRDDEALAAKVVNAGSVFLGNYSPESAGDYASGTNHTLPTNGFAKSYSGVSVDSFLKYVTFQKITKSGLSSIAEAITSMAEAEGLEAHGNAVRIRFSE
ncbi:MAG: histidinol dehydrogenase [Candidatus Kapaibacterium sp.]